MKERIVKPFGVIERIDYGFTTTDFNFNLFFKNKEFVTLKQIHSDIVLLADRNEENLREGDGVISLKRGLYSVVKTADCYPLLFYDIEQGFSGFLHVGWRGLYKRIIKKFVEKLEQRGFCIKESTFFLIGPGICGNCYEVGEDVYELFYEENFCSSCFRKKNKGNKFFLDIKNGIYSELNLVGVNKRNIYDSKICNFENHHFYSYRRGDKGKRIYSFIAVL